MDGTTRASEHCYIMSIDESYPLRLEEGNDFYMLCHKLGHDLFRHGMLNKRWLIIPFFVNQSHWNFYAFLNLTSIGQDQTTKFTAYFKYDSDGGMIQDHADDFEELDKYGVTSFLVYLVYMFGFPTLGKDINIRNVIRDPTKMPKIYLFDEDNFQQDDGYSCGVFCIMSLVYFSCCTAHLFSGVENLTFHDQRYHLPLNHWLSLFYVLPTQDRPKNIQANTRNKVRDQFTVLFNRLDLIKNQSLVQKRKGKIPTLTAFPKGIQSKFWNLVWGIGIKKKNLWLNSNVQKMHATNP
jgi:hypothetical protein